MSVHITRVPLPGLPGPATDIDLRADGAWVAACEVGPAACVIATSQTVVVNPVPDFQPFVRWMDTGDILVVGARTLTGESNAAIVSPEGAVRTRFFVGDAVEGVLVMGDRIVCSYFDEGMSFRKQFSCDGVVVFDTRGEALFSYYDATGATHHIDDAGCIATVGEHAVCFSPCVDYPLIILDLGTRAVRNFELPDSLRGFAALCSLGDGFVMHTTFTDRDALVYWAPGEEPRRLGEHVGVLRGLSDGRFLGVEPDGYAILEASIGSG